ncbi:hypothetical protein ADUPG1_009536 [Aduncisulcus paluster]|uniref:Mitochondrial import inner membrane translocase subunit TIM50 n=1 Tax=Aduncisulcus paluster TaxID=2918883 RepID=A0ABQ5KVX4_9EUKA|nr:hypothetical protein ADUPG1_009536 [Aduncisulcus paluster]
MNTRTLLDYCGKRRCQSLYTSSHFQHDSRAQHDGVVPPISSTKSDLHPTKKQIKSFEYTLKTQLDVHYYALYICFVRKVFRSLCRREKISWTELPVHLGGRSQLEKKRSESSVIPASDIHHPHFDLGGSLRPHMPVFLPPRDPKYSFSAVFDMDHTLLYASSRRMSGCNGKVVVWEGRKKCKYYVKIRPYARKLLEKVRSVGGEVIIFTAALQPYADRCLSILDPENRLIDYRLYRESCIMIGGVDIGQERDQLYEDVKAPILPVDLKAKAISDEKKLMKLHYPAFFEDEDDSFITSSTEDDSSPFLKFEELTFTTCYLKDLSRLARDERETFLIDDCPASYALQPLSAIACRQYYGEDDDEGLLFAGSCLFQAVRDGHTENCSGIIEALRNGQQHIERYRKGRDFEDTLRKDMETAIFSTPKASQDLDISFSQTIDEDEDLPTPSSDRRDALMELSPINEKELGLPPKSSTHVDSVILNVEV